MAFTPGITRFRAYQLGSPGSSFTYFADGRFRLVEARLTDHSKPSLEREMDICRVDRGDALDITSWDEDHCSARELQGLLLMVRPRRIEIPAFAPPTQNAREALRLIRGYQASQNEPVEVQAISPEYIGGLPPASAAAFRPVFYHPDYFDEVCNNNNSTVKLYREGSFNVLSLGDVECGQLSARLRRCSVLTRETDVMILAHHGADNGFTTEAFLERVAPRIAICTSDHGNQYDHPRQEIRDLLFEQGIRLMTTKTGDVVVRSTGTHTGEFVAINYIARSTEESSRVAFTAKKARLLSHNDDTIRDLYRPTPPYRNLPRRL